MEIPPWLKVDMTDAQARLGHIAKHWGTLAPHITELDADDLKRCILLEIAQPTPRMIIIQRALSRLRRIVRMEEDRDIAILLTEANAKLGDAAGVQR